MFLVRCMRVRGWGLRFGSGVKIKGIWISKSLRGKRLFVTCGVVEEKVE